MPLNQKGSSKLNPSVHQNRSSMKDNEFGFPFEYSVLSSYFDLLMPEEDTLKNAFIENILKRHNVKTVLDCTCGTGSQVFYLQKRGYQVVGSDISFDLLNIAKKKAQREKMPIEFIHGDMRTVRIDKLDAVITISNAIGHLKKIEFEKAIQNIHFNLKDGGIYIFDIFNLEAMTEQVVRSLSMNLERETEDTQIHHIQDSELNREKGQLISRDVFTIRHKRKSLQKLEGEFILQLYSGGELRSMLESHGFEVLDQCGIDGVSLSEGLPLNIFTIARKRER